MNLFQAPSFSSVKSLLASAGLPTADLSTELLRNFWGCGSPDALDGVVGLEMYGDVALLRSLAVCTDQRGRGLGQILVAHAERHAQSLGVGTMYLLTTTADGFFTRLGYRVTRREDAPQAIRQTAQFAGLCPSSSVFMSKALLIPAA